MSRSGAVTVARVRGIAFQIHPALVVLAILDVFLLGREPWLWGLIAGAVLLHEIGHSVVARGCGLNVSAIELHLLGGRTEMWGSTSEQNLAAVALAGPITSVIAGGALLALGVALPGTAGEIVRAAGWTNLAWAGLNLLPFYPLDGGHVVRYLLAGAVGPRDAAAITLVSASVAAVVMMALAGWAGLWPLVAVGAYLLLLAYREWVRQGLPSVGGAFRRYRSERRRARFHVVRGGEDADAAAGE